MSERDERLSRGRAAFEALRAPHSATADTAVPPTSAAKAKAMAALIRQTRATLSARADADAEREETERLTTELARSNDEIERLMRELSAKRLHVAAAEANAERERAEHRRFLEASLAAEARAARAEAEREELRSEVQRLGTSAASASAPSADDISAHLAREEALARTVATLGLSASQGELDELRDELARAARDQRAALEANDAKHGRELEVARSEAEQAKTRAREATVLLNKVQVELHHVQAAQDAAREKVASDALVESEKARQAMAAELELVESQLVATQAELGRVQASQSAEASRLTEELETTRSHYVAASAELRRQVEEVVASAKESEERSKREQASLHRQVEAAWQEADTTRRAAESAIARAHDAEERARACEERNGEMRSTIFDLTARIEAQRAQLARPTAESEARGEIEYLQARRLALPDARSQMPPLDRGTAGGRQGRVMAGRPPLAILPRMHQASLDVGAKPVVATPDGSVNELLAKCSYWSSLLDESIAKLKVAPSSGIVSDGR